MTENHNRRWTDNLHADYLFGGPPEATRERLATLLDSFSDGLVVVDSKWRYIYANAAAEKIMNRKRSELLGRELWECFPSMRGTPVEQYFRKAMAERVPVQFQAADEANHWYENRIYPSKDGGLSIYFHDISERKLAEADITQMNQELEKRVAEKTGQLLESEKRYRLLVSETRDYAIYFLDPTGHITTWNVGAQRIKGYTSEEVIGKHFSMFYTEEDRAQGLPQKYMAQALAQGRFTGEAWRVRKDGSRFWASFVLTALFDEEGRHQGFGKITRDLSEQRKANSELKQKEEALARSQKLEAVGRLAGGIAHDFNNLIAGIRGLAEELKSRSMENGVDQEELEEIIEASNRAFAVTKQLLAFGSRQLMQPKVLNLNTLIRDVTKLLSRLIGEHITIHLDLGEVGPIKADIGLMEQVLINLAVNSRDAMPNGGTIRIATEPSGRESVLLRFSDTGIGMSDETLARIFEPFFTTKPQDQGTGLGLSTVYGIIKQFGGEIFVKSRTGEGTTFEIVLPVTHEQEMKKAQPSAPEDFQAKGTVLVVEDEDIVRRVAVRRLTKRGYKVLEAASGSEARQLVQGYPEPIDLVVTDVVMPGMNGNELVQKLRMLRPGLLVLFMSGYPREVLAPQGILENGLEFLDKSQLNELDRRVREVLQKNMVGRPS